MPGKTKGIPYGISDFEKIRVKNKYFVDKTHFIPLLEEHEYVFFIRPRRFGKSLWISILECYYDIQLKERFDEFFKGTYIGSHPTPEKNACLILRFDFSMISPAPGGLEENFEKYCARVLDHFTRVYRSFFDEEFLKKMGSPASISEKLHTLFIHAQENGLKIYAFIDEYDHFSNTILSTSGSDAYRSLTRGEGFFRHFFAVLKGAAGMRGSGLARLFIAGVSPVTMDDVTSGFNIGMNISVQPAFNEMAGLSEKEARDMLNYYKEKNLFVFDVDESLEIMREWYDGYLFSDMASSTVLNTDMVLYFIHFSIVNQAIPRRLIDDNVKIDYGKLKRLMFINRRLNGNFDILKSIMEKGEIQAPVNPSFPIDQLLTPANFISLLYFFGLLIFKGTRHGTSLLAIPNMTISHLMYGYIRYAYRDSELFRINVWKFGDRVREKNKIGTGRQY
ncbi:conserved hypothetical protein [Candidatus Desulfarcum epimagneticum]|uniref:AAA-ATPase-like domain-containing protein n=1 Tax=uncultured Desulfobacteraceae bacterium TaxID=218296 RepID=A0A484HLE0_9BACT|nr:conserved hypothetical protein [uncultured Desulfobacteraceae bacterium]